MTSTNSGAKATLVKNTVILGLGKFSSQFVTFIMLPLYTSVLSPSEYGIVDVVITYVALLAPTLTLRMESAVFRFLIDARSDESEKSRIVSNSLQVALIMLMAVLPVGFALHCFIKIPYFWFIVGIVFAAVLSGWSFQIARGLGKNLHYAIASIIAGLVTATSNLTLLLVFGWGASGLLLSMMLAYTASTMYLAISLRVYRFVRLSTGDKELKKELIKYSAPLVPNGIAWWVINAADRTIILLVMGTSANGIFAVASKFPVIYTALFSVFGLSWTESASVHINDEDRDKFFSDTFNSAFRFFGSIGLGIIAALPLLFPVLVDQQFEDAFIYIPIMIIGALFNSIVSLYSAVYIAMKLTAKVATTSIMAGIISITCNLLFIQVIGLFAAAAANAIAFLTMAIYRHYDLKKYVVIKYSKSLLAALIFLYALVIGSYYINYFYLNILTLVAVALLALFLNRRTLIFLRRRIFSRT